MRLVDYLADSLAQLGVRHVFGVGGANIEDFYDSLSMRPDITAVVAKHEFGATTMADGYARLASRLGVVVATSGGGSLNLIPGLGEAYASNVPVLALVGQSPTALDGRGAFQDSSGHGGSLDAKRLFAAVTRYCARVEDPDSLPELLAEAVTAAKAGGPAALLLPKDVQQRTIDEPRPISALLPPRVDTDLELLEAARELTRAGTVGASVLIIAGDGVSRADARQEFARFADVLGASVAVAPDAKDTFDNRHASFVGVAGVMGHAEVRECADAADICVLVGTRLPMMTSAGLEAALAKKTVLSIGHDSPYVPVKVGVVTSDLGKALGSLADKLEASDRAIPAKPSSLPPRSLRSLGGVEHTGTGVSYREAVAAIEAMLPPDSDVFVDAGNTGASVAHYLPAPADGRFVIALGMGGMGYAFGAAIGSAFARGRRTYVIAGDGAFFMHGMEVHTALEHRLPVTFIVFNNDAHAMCVTREKIYYGGSYSYSRFRHSEIGVGMGAMFPGLHACHAKTATELTEALRVTQESHSPAFVSIDCDPDELPPFQPFLHDSAGPEGHSDVA